ncbi:hypothetical protein HGG82_03365 [Marinomonas sp. M1K-6]|uniref:Uncharacterized protein n=1 Tax=Marinomonas profundi TaxID=2726122 RepID=A0A847R6V2_9GAMM|nr:hypothetical protein [Marinomonas profundi]NLQ16664.1 hypothetical protein [Marinomonas profundi]UDV03759.1 hypothetical protein J8N69_02990 [Marinomonas profundi]
MTDKKTVWFPAKENGWGWGKPNTWQGWLVLVLYIATVAVVSLTVDPKVELLKWAVIVSVSTLVLLLVYLWKGDAPNWKWKPIEKDKRKWYK